MPSTVPQPLGSNLPLASSLPKVSFRKIPEQEAQVLLLPSGVNDQQNVNYGFNDGSPFEKPEHYMRFVEPIEADLKKQVEYDMDEQDKEWLDAFNADRRKDQLDTVSYEAFEVIIDRLEKEWFDLMRRVPAKPQPAAIGPDGEPLTGNEDTQCAICDDGECENSNAIVFCDGCNLAVHQDCYGIPYIPEGQWLCRKCTVSPDRAVSCILCPSEGGAFKQTTQGKWAHLLCGLWIPETSVSNQVYMEPIDSVEKIPKARWKLQCYLCRSRHGACIQCDNKTCFTAFHVTCARKASLLIKTQRQRTTHDHGNSDSEDEGEPLRAMCHTHLPRHLRPAAGILGKLPTDDDESSTRASTPGLQAKKPSTRKITIRRGANGAISAVPAAPPGTTKSARAYKKSYRAGPPLVPSYVIERVLAYVKKLTLRKKDLFIIQVAKFWSLKREARRGAPLLKRLHLEPWTAATSSNHEETEADRLQKLQFMLLLREDLERLRMLAELARKREQQKLRQMNLIRSTLIEGVLFPFHGDLRAVLEKIIAFDRSGLFMNPVSRSEVPDYYDVIRNPMDWARILAKIDDHQYASAEEFANDVNLVCDNAILYNKADTSFHRTALKIKAAAQPLLADLSNSIQGLHRAEAGEAGLNAIDALHDPEELQLEPSRSMLQALHNYDQERRERTIEEGEDVAHAPLNLVEDLIRQYHTVERPPPHVETPEEEERRLRREAAAAQKEQNRLKMNAAAAEYRKRRKAEKEAAAAAASLAPSGRASSSRLAALQDSDVGERRRSSRSAQGNDDTALSNEGSSLRRSASLRQANGNRMTPQTYLRRRRSDAASSGLETGQRSPRGLTVRKLNEHDTFTRFEAGWILPAGTHRARKSMGAEASSASATATAPSTSRSKSKSGTLQQPDSPAPSSELSDVGDQVAETPLSKASKKGTPGQAAKKASTRGFDSSPLPMSKGSRRRLSVNETPTTASSVGRGGVAADDTVLEKSLVDHAINDIKSNKKRGRASLLASEDISTPKRPRRISGVEAAGASKTPVTKSLERGKPTPAPLSSKKGGPVSVSPAMAFPHLTLVWAKVMSYPYYPAAIVDEADESVPAPVAKEGERQKAKAASSSDKSPLHLVRFFDQQKSFGWVRQSKLAMMFEDDAIDKGFAEAPKAPRSRQEIEEAMEEAKKSLDV